jgi:hypothetical protein
VRVVPDALEVDLSITAGMVVWEEVSNLVPKPGPGQTGVFSFPVLGTVKISAEGFRYGGLAWSSPLEAEVRLRSGEVEIQALQANLCGIGTPGTLSVAGEQVGVTVRPSAKHASVASALGCLLGMGALANGNFTLSGEVTASGTPPQLLPGASGTLELSAQDGRIYRYDLLAKIFSFLNVAELLRGKLPDLTQEGLEYDSIRLKVSIRDGKVHTEEGVLHGSSLDLFWEGWLDLVTKQIDFTVLVAPFSTLNSIVSYVPLLNYVLGGAVAAVPVRVYGNRDNPTVVPLSPSAVGDRLLGIVKRTLSLPYKLIQPLVPQ